jgi:hypothetical protein
VRRAVRKLLEVVSTAPAAPGGRRRPRPEALVFAAFALTLVVAHARHEFWRDEMHCWMVGRYASGLGDVLAGERRYDGHPPLWYAALHLLSRVSPTPVAMKVLVAAVSLAWGYVVAFGSPFLLYQRALLLFSYYLVYEYSVINRAYALGVLFVVLFCAAYHPRRVRYVTLGALLALLSATSAYGTLVAGALALFLFGRGLRPRGLFGRSWPFALAGLGRWLAGVAVFVFGVTLTYLTTQPPVDAYFDMPLITDLFTEPVIKGGFERYFIAMAPVPRLDQVESWGSVYAQAIASPWRERLPWAGACLLVAWLVALARQPFAALSYAVGVVVMGAFQGAKYQGSVRHWGHAWLLLFALLWLALKSSERRPRQGVLFQALFALTAGVQVFAGALLLYRDFRLPFSGAEETVAFIKSAGLASGPFVGAADHMVSNVAGQLDADFLYPQTDETGKTVVFHRRRRRAGQFEVLQSAKALAQKTDKEPVLVLTFPLYAHEFEGFRVETLFRSKPSLVSDENFFIYKLRRP